MPIKQVISIASELSMRSSILCYGVGVNQCTLAENSTPLNHLQRAQPLRETRMTLAPLYGDFFGRTIPGFTS